MSTSTAPILELPSKPNFMCIDGKTYLVDSVSLSPADMLKQTELYYAEALVALKLSLGKHISQECEDDLVKQITRIERHLKAGIVAIPDNLRASRTLLMLYDNKVHETRLVLYRPNRISCTLQRVESFLNWIHAEIPRRDAERFTKFVEWARPLIEAMRTQGKDLSAIKVDIAVEQDLIIYPMVASYIADINYIYVAGGEQHPHVYDAGTGKLCTGSSSARNFWDDPQFVSNFNSLNPHSFAHSSCNAARQHKNMLKNQYFINGVVRESEGSPWRVS